MTHYTVFFGLFRCYRPCMGLMALFAFHPHPLNVDLMLANIDYILVAVQAIAPIRPGGFMRFMAYNAVELHRSVVGSPDLGGFFDSRLVRLVMSYIESIAPDQFLANILAAVAEETFFGVGPQVFCPVGMAVKTGQLTHAGANHFFAVMASQTETFFRSKLMYNITMAFGARYLLLEEMFRV